MDPEDNNHSIKEEIFQFPRPTSVPCKHKLQTTKLCLACPKTITAIDQLQGFSQKKRKTGHEGRSSNYFNSPIDIQVRTPSSINIKLDAPSVRQTIEHVAEGPKASFSTQGTSVNSESSHSNSAERSRNLDHHNSKHNSGMIQFKPNQVQEWPPTGAGSIGNQSFGSFGAMPFCSYDVTYRLQTITLLKTTKGFYK